MGGSRVYISIRIKMRENMSVKKCFKNSMGREMI
jgi:hypothetical protein